MSGVFPGTRTQTFQRIQLLAVQSATAKQTSWAQVLWYSDPLACVVYLQGADGQALTTPLLRLAEPLVDFNQRLQAALLEMGWQLASCGACHFWQPSTVQTSDQLPVGHCQWQGRQGEQAALPPVLGAQANLALACPHWQHPTKRLAPDDLSRARSALAPLQKIAEISESKLSIGRRWQRRLWRLLRPTAPGRDWVNRLAERSGVGAGTEACFACQGRIANLGALAVESAEGDKQTFSIWRCRQCYTTYLNNWIDRWERLDTLETEESYYRLAPAEALELLTVIYHVVGGEHPGRRRERNTLRQHFLEFMAQRTALSHQIKQGR
jgi:hypothetical protein